MNVDAFKSLLVKAASGQTLNDAEAGQAFDIILRGEATEAQVSAFVTCLHMRGESREEIAAAARVLRSNVLRVKAPAAAIDMVGTGGDGVGTLNISTAASIVAAACGVKVAKHGNRALSSKSGAADVLAALGVKLSLTPDQISACIDKAGIGFMFAPDHHLALANVAAVRKQLGFRTVFNLLGPLCNPALVDRQLVGVFSNRWLEPFGDVLNALGSRRAWVVHGEDGLDEISISGPTHVVEVRDGKMSGFTIKPGDAGLATYPIASILGGDAEANAKAMRQLFDGETGAYHDIVCLNAAAGLVIAGVATSLRDGVEAAAKSIASGKARATLELLVQTTVNASKNVLAGISAYKADEIRAAKAAKPIADVERAARAASSVRPFLKRLQNDIATKRFGLIAEIKKASPSKGLIRADFNPPALARAYEAGGASCLSVLTDTPSFQGADAFLVEARAAASLPVLRKDFLYDPYQVVEARALGADCILIIMAAVSDEQASELNAAAKAWGMDVLVEVHNAAELDRAARLKPSMIGINNRDLSSFVTTLETTAKLAPHVPAGVLAVAESGINTHADIELLARSGVSAFLVGESLMRQSDVTQATRRLLGAKQ